MHLWHWGLLVLHATAVTLGRKFGIGIWYGTKSQHRELTLDKKILWPLLPGIEPVTWPWVCCSTTKQCPCPQASRLNKTANLGCNRALTLVWCHLAWPQALLSYHQCQMVHYLVWNMQCDTFIKIFILSSFQLPSQYDTFDILSAPGHVTVRNLCVHSSSFYLDSSSSTVNVTLLQTISNSINSNTVLLISFLVGA